MAVVAEARKRRDVDADDQVQLTQPLDADAQVQLTQPLGGDAKVQLTKPLGGDVKVQLTQPLGGDAQVQLTQPLHYAHNYPYYFVNNLLPTVKKVDEIEDMEMHMADETGKKVDEATAPQQYYLPMYAPSYDYPSLVQYPATTVTRTVGPWYPVQYPLSYPGLVPQLLLPPHVRPLLLLSLPGPIPRHHRDQDCGPLVPSPVPPLLPRPRASAPAASEHTQC